VAQLSIVIPFPRRARTRVAPGLTRTLGNLAFAIVLGLGLVAGALTVGPRFLPYQVLPVLTGSMEPVIPTGSLAVVVPVRGEELAVGDVITFERPQSPRTYITHRIVAIEDAGGGRALVTKGDANVLEDPWRVVGDGTGWRFAFTLPLVGGWIVAYETSPLRVALFVLPLVALAGLGLFEIWRPRPYEIRRVAQAA
jgi:signal peptidase